MRILVVDDHALIRRSVVALLRASGDFEVAEAADAFEAIQLLEENFYDVILMDISLPRMNGFDATRVIKEMVPDTEILFLSQHLTPGMISEAMRAGGRGYVAKTDAARELIQAIRAVAARQTFLSSTVGMTWPVFSNPESTLPSSET